MKRICVEHLSKTYGEKPVLRDVTFTASAAQITCVMAPSGAGKTTLLRILMGLETPDAGRVVCTPQPCRWAAVFQEDRLLERLDAAGNLRFALGAGYDASRAAALLEALGLSDTAGGCVDAFSGGMKRRLALARALLAESDALALDEPFTGLDAETCKAAAASIRRLAADKAVILVTHSEEAARELDAQIIRL